MEILNYLIGKKIKVYTSTLKFTTSDKTWKSISIEKPTNNDNYTVVNIIEEEVEVKEIKSHFCEYTFEDQDVVDFMDRIIVLEDGREFSLTEVT